MNGQVRTIRARRRINDDPEVHIVSELSIAIVVALEHEGPLGAVALLQVVCLYVQVFWMVVAGIKDAVRQRLEVSLVRVREECT